MSPDESASLDREYNPLLEVSSPSELFSDWSQRSAAARDAAPHDSDIAYGPSAAEALDIFPSSRPNAPVLIFVHGGFWRGSDKATHSFLAPAFTARGAAVVFLNYGLCPAVRIEAIVEQVARGVAWVYRNIRTYGGDPLRLVLAGHSAGAHLAAMLLTRNWMNDGHDLPVSLADRALCISGLFDLEAVQRVPYLQRDLALTPASARTLSPVAHQPRAGAVVYSVVGEMESSAFLGQHHALRAHWGQDAVPISESIIDRSHFDILEDLANPSARLHALATELLHADSTSSSGAWIAARQTHLPLTHAAPTSSYEGPTDEII